ncbi:outer membrane protein assembly factor BamB family protein [Allokutzneria albata]|uniref:PQQ-like domain-containing protein n=1 Tax=Allokutzneria albata TaxID=211114 RepID=A0A1G9UJ32_ALLAB|nr:PQQ-binding-like beta-propeller repeat protein [Allokutzneria albata]SDM59887.1 PQQ-like domain-containing protein [Allokutzneria albata]
MSSLKYSCGLAALALAVSACGTPALPEAAKSSEAAPTSTVPPAKTADPPTVFDTAAAVPLPRSMAQTNIGGGVTSKYTTLNKRTAYTVTPVELNAVDVLTGEQKWVARLDGVPADPNFRAGPFVTNAGPRPPAVDNRGSLVVAAMPTSEPGKGTTPGYQSLAVIAVDAESGTKRWESRVRVPDSIGSTGGSGAITKVVAVTETAVVATYRKGEAMTVVLDAATGRTLWERPEYEAGSVHGDVVVGADSNVAENKSMIQATALALSDGAQRWVGAARSSAVTVVPAGPAMVVIDSTNYGSGDPALLFLDPATGAERGKLTHKGGFGPSAYGKCDYDQQSVVVCLANGRLAGYDASTGKELWALPDKTTNRIAPTMTIVWHGALYGRTTNGPVVLDAKTGADRSAEPGIAPHWVSEYVGIGVNSDGVPQAYPVKQ